MLAIVGKSALLVMSKMEESCHDYRYCLASQRSMNNQGQEKLQVYVILASDVCVIVLSQITAFFAEGVIRNSTVITESKDKSTRKKLFMWRWSNVSNLQ